MNRSLVIVIVHLCRRMLKDALPSDLSNEFTGILSSTPPETKLAT